MAGNHVIRWPLNMAQVAVSDGNLQHHAIPHNYHGNCVALPIVEILGELPRLRVSKWLKRFLHVEL